ncbi:hypothetical protein ABKA04_005437 [Annulohypoxylon sp. FPYF3050]
MRRDADAMQSRVSKAAALAKRRPGGIFEAGASSSRLLATTRDSAATVVSDRLSSPPAIPSHICFRAAAIRFP